MLSLIVIVATTFIWFGYQDIRNSRNLELQFNETLQLPLSSPDVTPETASPNNETPVALDLPVPNLSTSAASPEPPLTSSESPLSSSATPNNTEPPALVSKTTTDTPPSTAPSTAQPSESATASSTSETVPTACSSFDEAGLLATFDSSLASFIADASTTYGSQYENLQYQLSSKTAVIDGEQGTVTTNYSGTVKELSTSQDVTANGLITATFKWDGCVWQLIDYTF
jgi:hypothetical protein